MAKMNFPIEIRRQFEGVLYLLSATPDEEFPSQITHLEIIDTSNGNTVYNGNVAGARRRYPELTDKITDAVLEAAGNEFEVIEEIEEDEVE